jgi:hypothetical protein
MKRYAPATLRNREPILEVLRRHLPQSGLLIEIASGSGEHGAFLAPHFPGLAWQPSDVDSDNLASIDAWRDDAPNMLPPIRLDVRERPWPLDPVAAVFCANMIHISPWDCTPALMNGAAETLAPGGVLAVYGPFMEGGVHTAPSNADFDLWLKGQNPEWGVRDLGVVKDEAARAGLIHVDSIAMPANNLSVIWRKPEA